MAGVPGGGALVGVRHPQHRRLLKRPPRQQDAQWQSSPREARWHRQRWQPRQVEGPGVGWPPLVVRGDHFTTWKVSCNLLNLRKEFTEGFFRAIFGNP